ncbi:sugar ABC transporter ATP-binding protein [Lachnospiraceae bacterium ZAX-1]
MERPILELKDIKKVFPGVVALDDVSLSFEKGEVHAIAGENGAGKSTFIKVITGAHKPTSGSMFYNGEEIKNNSPILSMKLGIAAIYQEFNLFPALTVAENVYYGRYPLKSGIVDMKKLNEMTDQVMARLGVSIKPTSLVKELSVGYQQIVEIAKAVSCNAKLLIMDEPSAPLTENEVSHLFDIIEILKKQEITIIYISHRMEEIFKVCDRVSVFRDGKYIETLKVPETNTEELIKSMVNRDLGKQYPKANYKKGKKALEIKGLNTGLLKDIHLEAYEGEILGLAGLVGAGRTEIARALFGADKRDSGTFIIDGKEVNIKIPSDAIKAGIGLIPEDRKNQGVLLGESIRHNISFANLKGIIKNGFISEKIDSGIAKKYSEILEVKTPSVEQKVGNLSGGNQQKIVLAKWLFTDSRILIFDEPTRGIDVGAKQEIYKLMHKLVEDGKVVIMISSEMPELIGMADRILVLHEGAISGNVEKEEFTQERIMTYASGIRTKEVAEELG